MATLKNTSINDTGFLKLPVGTSAERPSSPSIGMIRYNTTLSTIEYFRDFWYTLNGNISFPIDYVVVAGGGNGVTTNITNTPTIYGVGGDGMAGTSQFNSGTSGLVNRGNGGGGADGGNAGNGGSGIVIISYLSIYPNLLTIHSSHVCNGQAAGGTTTAPAPSTARTGYKTYTFTAGSGNISW